MVVKNKEEQKKKKKPKSTLAAYLNIQKNLSLAESLQKVMMQSPTGLKALAESAKALQIKQATNTLQAISNIQTAIGDMALRQASLVHALQASAVIKTLERYQKSVQNLAQNYLAINKLIQVPKINIPMVAAKIDNIPSETGNIVQSLLGHIDYLERELAKKEEENKELRRILHQLKEKLKTSYVV